MKNLGDCPTTIFRNAARARELSNHTALGILVASLRAAGCDCVVCTFGIFNQQTRIPSVCIPTLRVERKDALSMRTHEFSFMKWAHMNEGDGVTPMVKRKTKP
nr:hypothetical protein [Janthinobacterium sp.]